MGIQQGSAFARTFGRNGGAQPMRQDEDAKKKPPAQVWLNIGYIIAEGTEEQKFVSLPMGIGLDNMEPVSTRSSNPDFAMFQAARNDLHAQLLEQAGKLGPGEDYILRVENSDLCIQVRRVNAEQAAPSVDPNANRYALKLFA